jgi:alpha-glucosidase
VKSLEDDPQSILTLYRRLIDFRRSHKALSIGSYVAVDTHQEHVFAYARHYRDERLAVVLNLGHESESVDLPDNGGGEILLSTHLDRAGERIAGRAAIRPDEGLIIKL